MSSSQMSQLNRLMEELEVVKNSRRPEEAGREIRDFVDLHAHIDQLAGTSESMNPWIPEKEQKSKMKKKKG